MSRFDSIVVGNDLVSEHWLAEQFPATVKVMRAAWKEREDHGKATPRSGVTALAGTFGGQLARLRESGDSADLLGALHAAVRKALQLPAHEETWAGVRADAELSLAAASSPTPDGTHLLVLQARDARTVEDLLDNDGAGRLLTPGRLGSETLSTTAKAISEIFQCEEPPALVLVTAGAWLLLAERGSWPEGRWLAVDLATVCERRDLRAAGELETAVALVSGDALSPGPDGSILLLTLLAESVKHAVGVSQDLRDGIRESIEILATDVLRRRRAAGLADDRLDLAADLTRQCLRYLYRILFLLYAEARPELGVLPIGAPEYAEGYGLDRLRELVLTELTTETAQHGTHVYASLATLFRLVNEGYPTQTFREDGPSPAVGMTVGQEDRGELRFEALRADLFSPRAVALIDEVGLGNRACQRVLSRLLLSARRKGRARGFVSYAQLGINQLGAVYEGLMSYTGSLARAHSVEVAKGGDRSEGSWVVPVTATEGFDESWFVQVENPETGVRGRVTYAPGDFVFRLSGYERQRSASYYTPEVLTSLVVRHSLAELLDQDGAVTPAADLLALTVCEPAMGSGAFLVEAVNQLAAQYLDRRQDERGMRIPAEEYPAELQKVKAHLALHQCYGVDLNATAVELAEITLWLDAMHPGLRSPWFGLHLRRGNSLIGARREVYAGKEMTKRVWLTTVPTPRPLGESVEAGEVHHFLLPAAGWGAVVDTKEAKELAPDARVAVAAWRKSVTAALSTAEQKRLAAVAQRVEVLWALTRRRLEVAEAEARRSVDVWGADLPAGTGAVQREEIEWILHDTGSPYQRLHRVMDAWAALWAWPLTTEVAPPTKLQWIDGLEALLGVETKQGRGMFGESATWDELHEAEANERGFARMRPISEAFAAHPWLVVCQEIAQREGYFHWELTFAPVFARGGFDLQLGNPPWVRPDWDDSLVLAESDAWFGLTHQPSVVEFAARRDHVLKGETGNYLDARARIAAMSSHLGSTVDRPLLDGLRPDLYRCFMDRTWRSLSPAGVVGLIHPESHFTEARAGSLRRHAYERLRQHWNFRNEFKLFEIGNTRTFGVHIYGASRDPHFLNAASLYHPDTVGRSLRHDGSGPEPGIKDEDDHWDTRPHAARVLLVDDAVLASWAALIDEPGTAAREARMLLPVTYASQKVMDQIARSPRFGAIGAEWTSGWNEKTDRIRGFFVKRTADSSTLDDVILQGPHLGPANMFFQNPPLNYRTFKDYQPVDLELLSESAIPRTNFQRATPPEAYLEGYPRWQGKPANNSFRLAWRRRADTSTVRTLHAALVPPGPMHVDLVRTAGDVPFQDLAVAAAMWASLPVDFFVKAAGITELKTNVTSRFPHPRDHPLIPELVLRALRLNCLTADYAPLWSELFDPAWQRDTWTRDLPAVPLGGVDPEWTMATPLRRDAERRQALVEIDALAAVMLGITAEELCAIYRTQFGVLRKYERVMQMDANGRQVSREVLKDRASKGVRADLGRYELPFTPVDREAEMTTAHVEFTRRLAARGTS